MKTMRDHLLGALENLQSDNLKKFKVKLSEFPVKKSCENIPQGLLEKADVSDVVQRLLNYYGEKYAVELTIKILKFINCKDQAGRLYEATTKRPTLKPPRSAGHFISPPVRLEGTIPSATMSSSTKSSASKASKTTTSYAAPKASKTTTSSAAPKAPKTTTSSAAPKASTSTLAALNATPGRKRSALKSSSSGASCSTAAKHPSASSAAPLAHSFASGSPNCIGNSSTWGNNVASRFKVGIGGGGNPALSVPSPLVAQQQPSKKGARGRQPGSRAVKK